jgi:cell division protein FtsB
VTRARWAALAIAVAAVFFALQGGEYSTLDHMQLERAERAESLKVERLKQVVDSLARVAEAVETDPKVQERVARERYGMIRDGEFVYRLVAPDTAAAP